MCLAGSGHLAVVLNAVTLRRGASALVPQHGRRGHAGLLQDVIRKRQGGVRQFQASRRAVLGHRLRAGGKEKIDFGEDVFEGLQTRFIDWYTPMLKQVRTKKKR